MPETPKTPFDFCLCRILHGGRGEAPVGGSGLHRQASGCRGMSGMAATPPASESSLPQAAAMGRDRTEVVCGGVPLQRHTGVRWGETGSRRWRRGTLLPPPAARGRYNGGAAAARSAPHWPNGTGGSAQAQTPCGELVPGCLSGRLMAAAR